MIRLFCSFRLCLGYAGSLITCCKWFLSLYCLVMTIYKPYCHCPVQSTLVYRIEVQVNLSILKRNSRLHGLILVYMFINLEEIFLPAHIGYKNQLQYFLKTDSFCHQLIWEPFSNSFKTVHVSPLSLYCTARLSILWNSPTCAFFGPALLFGTLDPLLICNWFLKNRFHKMEFDKIHFWSISNFYCLCCLQNPSSK